MPKKHFIKMTRKELEEVLAKQSPEEQDRIRRFIKHAQSMYDYAGKHIPHELDDENLLEVISRQDTYVVDSNSEWKKECKENPDKAFIISPPLSRENPNTKDLILDAKRSSLGNIYSMGIDLGLDCFLVERVDENFRSAFDLAKLNEASKGKGPTVAKQKARNSRTIELEKKRIQNRIGYTCLCTHWSDSPLTLAFIMSGKASDLPSPDRIPSLIAALKAEISRRLPYCKRNVDESKIESELCHATLLLEDIATDPSGTRPKYDKADYEHVFGDMHILQAAIYLDAKILTKDNKLIQMAGYAGIKCHHVPQKSKA